MIAEFIITAMSLENMKLFVSFSDSDDSDGEVNKKPDPANSTEISVSEINSTIAYKISPNNSTTVMPKSNTSINFSSTVFPIYPPFHNHILSNSANIPDSDVSAVTDSSEILPGNKITPTDGTIDKQPTKASTNTGNGRQQTKIKRNFTDDGTFNTQSERKGQDKSDAFYHRSITLIRKAQQLHNVSNCAVSVTIKPLTDRAKLRHYESPNFHEHDIAKGKQN